MRTIRRLYLYAVAFVSLETVLWGLINLLRASLDAGRVGGSASQLAGALALILVGLPVFLLHWWLIQRRIGSQPEERGAGLPRRISVRHPDSLAHPRCPKRPGTGEQAGSLTLLNRSNRGFTRQRSALDG